MRSETVGRPPDINLVDAELYSQGDPHAQWRWLRDHSPLYWHSPTDLPGFWCVTRYADVRAVYRDWETFSSAHGILLRPSDHGPDPGGGRTLALTDPPRHRALRGLVDAWFSVRAVRALEPELAEIACGVVDRAIELGSCDLVADVAARIPLYVICKMMGVPAADWAHLYDLTSRAFTAGDPLTRRFAHLEILGYFEQLHEAKAADPRDDLLSVLAAATVDGAPLDPQDIILNCDNLLVGGTENTRIATAGGVLAFLQHPEQWRALSDDPDLLPTAVEEVLRWTSTATHIMRTAVRPAGLHGQRIAAGERVVLWLPSANRDDRVFPDPDRFDVTRQPNRHLALGFAEHFCLGSVLARVELRLLFQELLARPVRIELDGAPRLLDSIVVNGPEYLPVRLTTKAA